MGFFYILGPFLEHLNQFLAIFMTQERSKKVYKAFKSPHRIQKDLRKVRKKVQKWSKRGSKMVQKVKIGQKMAKKSRLIRGPFTEIAENFSVYFQLNLSSLNN